MKNQSLSSLVLRRKIMKSSRRTETGQVLVILTFGMIALFGIAALAIDGGMLYADRRVAQNAVDASVMAGGGAASRIIINAGEALINENWKCDTVNAMLKDAAIQAAENNAKLNNITIDGDQTYITTDCSQVVGNKHFDVHMVLTYESRTALAHLVFNDVLQNRVEAVARIFPRVAIGEGNVIISLTTDPCTGNTKGSEFSGNHDIDITVGGGIFSHSCLIKSGTSGKINLIGGGKAYYMDTYSYPPGQPDPFGDNTPIKVDDGLEIDISPPECGNSPEINHTGSGTITPGNYRNIRVNNKDELFLDPGLYCLSGDFTVLGQANVTGHNLTIYLSSNGSTFTTSGGGAVKLSAPPATCDYIPIEGVCPPALPGILIYMSGISNKGVSLTGNSDSSFEGTIYAPYSPIEVGGTGDVVNEFGVQLIGNVVDIHGNASLNLAYRASKFFHTPVLLQLDK
jgi:hypothetical protein